VRSVDLVLVIEAALDVVRPAADAKNIRLHRMLDTESGVVAGDPGCPQHDASHDAAEG
jgi:hypothetical protein